MQNQSKGKSKQQQSVTRKNNRKQLDMRQTAAMICAGCLLLAGTAAEAATATATTDKAAGYTMDASTTPIYDKEVQDGGTYTPEPSGINAAVDNRGWSVVDGDASASAYGIYNEDYNELELRGNKTVINVNAWGGAAVSNTEDVDAGALAYGIYGDARFEGDVVITANAWGGVATAGGAYIFGQSCGVYDGTTDIGGNMVINANAWGGEAAVDNGSAFVPAIANGLGQGETNIGGNAFITANAWGGKATATNSDVSAYAQASGSGANFVTNIGGNAFITANAWGGEATSANAKAEANAYANGISYNESDISGNAVIAVNAHGGKANNSPTSASALAQAYGLSDATISISGKTLINASAWGGTITNAAGDLKADGEACGIITNHSSNSVKLLGDVEINTFAKGGTINGAAANGYAYAVKALAGTVEINKNGGHTVRLTGDVLAAGSGGSSIDLVLDNDASFLRGNVLLGNVAAGQVVNLTVANGAVWQPVYDNRNGTFVSNSDRYIDKQEKITNESSYKEGLANYIEKITLQNSGMIDLTGDDSQRTNGRTLTINNLDGDYGVVKLNTNVQNIAGLGGDKITVNNSTSNVVGVAVGYDPVYKQGWGTYSGSYNAIDGSGSGSLTVYGVVSENRAGRYTPIMDGGNIVALTLTPSSNLAAAAGAAKNAALVNRGLANHLNKRLGELRQNPKEEGVWTRIWRGDLENNAYGTVKAEYKGMQLGYDKASAENGGTGWFGAAVSYADANTFLPHGAGASKAYDLAVYKTWLGKNGHYYDVVLHYGKQKNDYHTTDISRNYSESDYKTTNLGATAEYGYRKALGNGWYLQPQGELSWLRQGSVDYTASSGMQVAQDSIDSVTGRLGLGLGKELGNGTLLYTTVSAVHEFDGRIRLRADGLPYSQNYSGTWCEAILGITGKIDDKADGYASFEKLFGGDVSGSWQVNAGLRFSF